MVPKLAQVGFEVVSVCVLVLQKQFKMAVKDVAVFVTLIINCSAQNTHTFAVLAKSCSPLLINLVVSNML